MRKPDFCVCENKGADQHRSNCFNVLDYTGQFVSDQVGNTEDRFSHFAAHLNQVEARSCFFERPA